MTRCNRPSVIVLVVLATVARIQGTSLPVGDRGRQLLYYPSQSVQLEPLLQIPADYPQFDRVDINQRIRTPTGFYLYYPHGGLAPPNPPISPSINEIFPPVERFDPNSVIFPTNPHSPGTEPEIDPDAVIITNLDPSIDMPQPKTPEFPEIEQKTETDAKEPTDNGTEITTDTDTTVFAGEQDDLAAADRNPAVPQNPMKPGLRFPIIQPGHRFFVLNGQAQFGSYYPNTIQPQNGRMNQGDSNFIEKQQAINPNIYYIEDNRPRLDQVRLQRSLDEQNMAPFLQHDSPYLRPFPKYHINDLQSGPNPGDLSINPVPLSEDPTLNMSRCNNDTKFYYKKKYGRTSSFVHFSKVPPLSSTSKVIFFFVLYIGMCFVVKQ